MTLTGGNAAIRDRKPQLVRLRGATSWTASFIGRFETIDQERRPAVRDGLEHSAIVFVLRRVADSVDS